MTTPKIILIAAFALSMIASSLLVGEEREPITRGQATAAIVINLILIWLVIVA